MSIVAGCFVTSLLYVTNEKDSDCICYPGTHNHTLRLRDFRKISSIDLHLRLRERWYPNNLQKNAIVYWNSTLSP